MERNKIANDRLIFGTVYQNLQLRAAGTREPRSGAAGVIERRKGVVGLNSLPSPQTCI